MKKRNDIHWDSMQFYNKRYLNYKILRGMTVRTEACHLNIGDEVYIHPVPGVSEAKKEYPAMIACEITNWVINGRSIPQLTLIVKGSRKNKGYKAVINEYLFNRLEFLYRKI